MLTYEEALTCLEQAIPKPRTVLVALDEALGLILAQPVCARTDLPPFDNTAVDGYAIASGGSLEYQIVGESFAGRPFATCLQPGQAVRILTGAPVPAGTDTVVMQEHAQRQGDRLLLDRWPPPGQHIRRRGEDIQRGMVVLSAGAQIQPEAIGLLAALGERRVRVYRRPTVAIMVTGDELVVPGARLKHGQIYESNGALLRALVRRAGAHVLHLGLARDQRALLMSKIQEGLRADLLLITGGVSVGDRDVVRSVARACGVKALFWQVNIKPGMPLFCGTRGHTLLFGLPGNPVSVFVTFEEFVKPILARLMGRVWQDGYAVSAILAQDLVVSPTRRTHFVRVRCEDREGAFVAIPVHGQGSHQLKSLVDANGWIRVQSDQGPWSAGTQVRVKLASPQALEMTQHVEVVEWN